MDNDKEFTPLCNAEEVAKFKANLTEAIDGFRNALGARNVEIIVSVKESQSKCDLTVRY